MDWDLFKFPTLPEQSVPNSCCIRNLKVPTRDCGNGILSPSRPKAEIETIIFAKVKSYYYGN